MTRKRAIKKILRESRRLIAEGREADNQRLLRAAVERFPDDADLSLRAGTACLLTSNADAASYAARAATISPEDPDVLTQCASIVVSFDPVKAAEYAESARRIAGRRFTLAPEVDHIFGRIAWSRGDYAAAEAMLSSAFNAWPDEVGYGAWLARVYDDTERYEEALTVLEKALQHRPDDELLHQMKDEIGGRTDRS